MRIDVTFVRGSEAWRAFILESAKTASVVLSDPEFLEKVGAWPKFDQTRQTPAQVAELLRRTTALSIRVGFYNRPLGPSIAKEVGGAVLFNTAKRNRGAGSPGNVAHEVMHVLKFEHRGNRYAGNANTVPWRIGQWVSEWLAAPPAYE